MPTKTELTQLPVLGSHASAVQGLPSPHSRKGPAAHLPLAQMSLTVQGLPSSHCVWSGNAEKMQAPFFGSQLSEVHPLPSVHDLVVPDTQVAPLHPSPTVHGLPSSQGPETTVVLMHPLTGSQLSLVQALLSLHEFCALPKHWPPSHKSFAVQMLPSVHAAPLFKPW